MRTISRPFTTLWLPTKPHLDATDRRLAGLLLLVLALNITDSWLTLHVVQSGLGWELNPLMRSLLTGGPSYFLGVKLFLCGLAVTLLWFARQHKLAHRVAIGATLIYGAVVVYTLLNLAR